MPFIPLHDRNPRILIEHAWVTWGVMFACGLIYLGQSFLDPAAGNRLAFGLGLIPAIIAGGAELEPSLRLVPGAATLVTYMFLHGGFWHLAGNMLFLWVFGDNIEDSMGHGRFAAFYLAGGAVAGLVQVLVEPLSRTPVIGASGAVAAVLGAYLILHPKAKILVPIIIFPVYLPAWLLLSAWIGFQVWVVLAGAAPGVAWWAHIGGFAAGAIMIVPLRRKTQPLFGGGDLPGGLRIRRGYRRRDGDGDGDGDEGRQDDPRG
jgi:membrane associated rhomboid family serine protease